jgi:ribonuclease P protein component
VAGSQGRRGRITRSADFDRVYRSGRSHANRMLVLHTFPRGDTEPSRLGLSVSRKVGGAVDRNLVKRLLREAFDARSNSISPGNDIVAVARSGMAELAENGGLSAVDNLLAELIEEAGLRLDQDQ